MSNLLFKISHFTGKTTRILSALQELFPSSDGFDLKFRLDLRFRWKVLKSYIFKMPRTFLWNNYFLSNLCILICHWTGKCLWSFAGFSENPEETDPPRSKWYRGEFPIYYISESRTRRKRTPLEAPGTNSLRAVLFLWVLDPGNIVNRKPPRGGGFLSIKL